MSHDEYSDDRHRQSKIFESKNHELKTILDEQKST